MLYLAILSLFAVLLWWGLGGASSKAARAHAESQIRLPGQLAIEVGKSFLHRQSGEWRLWFEDAMIRYRAADQAWWKRYKVVSPKRQRGMVERRMTMQADIGEYIDPVECLRRLAKIAQETLDERPARSGTQNPGQAGVPDLTGQ